MSAHCARTVPYRDGETKDEDPIRAQLGNDRHPQSMREAKNEKRIGNQINQHHPDFGGRVRHPTGQQCKNNT